MITETLIRTKVNELRTQGVERITSNELAYWVRNDLGYREISINGGAKQIGKILGPYGIGLKKFGKYYKL